MSDYELILEHRNRAQTALDDAKSALLRALTDKDGAATNAAGIGVAERQAVLDAMNALLEDAKRPKPID